MQLYLDTSALVKLVVKEPESAALETYLGKHSADTGFTAALARTELVRAVARQQLFASVEHARRVLRRIDLVPLTNRLLDAAATLAAPELRAMVTYDSRLAAAAADAGIDVVAPR